jgi:hypothetical protein
MEEDVFRIGLDHVQAAAIDGDHWTEDFLDNCEDFFLHAAVHQADVKFTTALDPLAMIPYGCAREPKGLSRGARGFWSQIGFIFLNARIWKRPVVALPK